MSLGALRLVASNDGLTGEDILANATAGNGLTDTADIIKLAREVADETVALVRRDKNSALLASVLLVMQDQRLKVAFLECIGEKLML